MIIIPMAGLSSRFFKAGYEQPKYKLIAHGKSLFEHAVSSFSNYYDKKHFLFIIRDVYDTECFVEQKAKSMGITNFTIVSLNKETRGQAETVTLGIEGWQKKVGIKKDCSITIFNIDTFRPGFKYPALENMGDGYLEVFQGKGENWSFVKPKCSNSTIVCETAEKRPISDLCCTGLYHFKSLLQYLSAYQEYISKPIDSWEKGELYVAPLYNHLIELGCEIHYQKINRGDVIFCGVPDEYEDFILRR